MILGHRQTLCTEKVMETLFLSHANKISLVFLKDRNKDTFQLFIVMASNVLGNDFQQIFAHTLFILLYFHAKFRLCAKVCDI